jgi:hypothetical protein
MSARVLEALAGMASLALLGCLSGGWVMAVAGPLMVLVGLAPMIFVAALANGSVRKAEGFGGMSARLAAGFAFAVPFAVLAAACRYGLGWNASAAFAGAALAAGMSAGGLDLVKAGCGKVTGLLLPGLWSALLMVAWVVGASWLSGAGA